MSRRSKKRRPHPAEVEAATEATSAPSLRRAILLGPETEPSAWLRDVEQVAGELSHRLSVEGGGAVVMPLWQLMGRPNSGCCDRCDQPGVTNLCVIGFDSLLVVLGLCRECSSREGWKHE